MKIRGGAGKEREREGSKDIKLIDGNLIRQISTACAVFEMAAQNIVEVFRTKQA